MVVWSKKLFQLTSLGTWLFNWWLLTLSTFLGELDPKDSFLLMNWGLGWLVELLFPIQEGAPENPIKTENDVIIQKNWTLLFSKTRVLETGASFETLRFDGPPRGRIRVEGIHHHRKSRILQFPHKKNKKPL